MLARSRFPVIYLYRFALIVLSTVIWAGTACVVGLFDRSGEGAVWAARNWVRWILTSCRVEVECDGLESLDPNQPYVFMSNHQSVFDVAAIVSTLPVSFRFVAKRELTWIPIFGWALVLGRHIIVDRRNRTRSVESLESAARQVRGGTNVIIFPEGTRSATGSLGEFKSGGFHLAIRAGVPVFPIAISGSRRIAAAKSLRVESGRIRVSYGSPIPTATFTMADRNELKKLARAAIASGIDPDFPRAPGAAT
jgi:1-acyl-sn-glycerol-3-phosphate acyltransferase